jgi:hypothetical protein
MARERRCKGCGVHFTNRIKKHRADLLHDGMVAFTDGYRRGTLADNAGTVWAVLGITLADVLGYCDMECAQKHGAAPLDPWSTKLDDVAAASAAPGDGTSTPPASETAEDALVEVDTGPRVQRTIPGSLRRPRLPDPR